MGVPVAAKGALESASNSPKLKKQTSFASSHPNARPHGKSYESTEEQAESVIESCIHSDVHEPEGVVASELTEGQTRESNDRPFMPIVEHMPIIEQDDSSRTRGALGPTQCLCIT